jgi:hypothetical protein
MSTETKLIQEWDTWEPLYKADIERIAYRMKCTHMSMGLAGINKKHRSEFIEEKLIELVKEIIREG